MISARLASPPASPPAPPGRMARMIRLARPLLALLLALLLPPAGIWLRRGPGPGFWAGLLLAAAGLGTFRLIAAAPGLGLWALAVLLALALVLLPGRPGRSRRATGPALPAMLALLFGLGGALLPGHPGPTGGAAPPDPAAVARGREVAELCQPCHAMAYEENRVGPSLYGIIGRGAGTHPGYDYSEAMRGMDFPWEAGTIAAFAQDPEAMFPGTRMAVGTISQEEADDLAVYLTSIQPR